MIEIDHASIYANDLQAGIDFYTKDMEMEMLQNYHFEDRKFDMVYMNTGKNILELLHNKTPHEGPLMGHIAFRVKDTKALAEKLAAQGVELRTVQSTIDLWDLNDFSLEALPETRRRFQSAGLEVVVVGTSISFAKDEPGWRSRQLELLEKFCVIAQGLNCPYLRVFGGPIPPGSTYEAALGRDIDGYRQAVKAAASYGVTLLFETHDDFSTSTSLLPLLEAVGNQAGVIWDILHPYRFGEPMETTCRNLLPYLRHVHVKDSSRYSKEGFDIVLPGQGTVPIREALSLLRDCGYEGYLCFEWEKHWHPEIQEAELALPEYVNYMRRYAKERLHEQA